MTPQQLKASILKYAMQGKLVEQKPEDGTGEDLFCKMQQVSKPNKNVTPIVEEEIPFDIPSSWKWCKFGELVDCSMGKTPPRAEPVWWQNDIHWVSISDMKDYGHISYTKEMVSQKALEEKSQEAGFESLADCRSWYEKRDFEKTLTQDLETYRRLRQGAEKVAADEKDFLKDSPKPDMAHLGQEDQDHQSAIHRMVKMISDGENRKKLLEDTAAKVKDIAERHEKTLQDASLVSGLYNLTRGEKSRITLERYVLGALLDEVTRAANLRLLDMSHHRYSLHRMAGDSTDGRGGLTLEVSDSYTGRSRPANTLSGGETFLASLSLALGLADVVQAKQGGVRLDTMFIDEGFGTLDPEALNSAMNTLIDLQNTGRLVGIISHVPELEERIDARLKVTPAEKGSKAEFEILE